LGCYGWVSGGRLVRGGGEDDGGTDRNGTGVSVTCGRVWSSLADLPCRPAHGSAVQTLLAAMVAWGALRFLDLTAMRDPMDISSN